MSLGIERQRESKGFGSRNQQVDKAIDVMIHRVDELRLALDRVAERHHPSSHNTTVCQQCLNPHPCADYTSAKEALEQ
ncbi:hypothetical protein KHQ84_gp175 [Rhodococcus phage Finch]|uniref:Uncharacterized protein n=1 Tax=Rhodococcus phage Finch TaxID=2094144 RepID=A0A2P1JXQ6_9CAUD|nr:hypothetical protein KHQ84_gp175 [Rhodococcus phage Finch]AVO25102.1 hypothetical protein SEA_FINCH_175 [Rhodococcus phage Finch]